MQVPLPVRPFGTRGVSPCRYTVNLNRERMSVTACHLTRHLWRLGRTSERASRVHGCICGNCARVLGRACPRTGIPRATRVCGRGRSPTRPNRNIGRKSHTAEQEYRSDVVLMSYADSETSARYAGRGTARCREGQNGAEAAEQGQGGSQRATDSSSALVRAERGADLIASFCRQKRARSLTEALRHISASVGESPQRFKRPRDVRVSF